MVLLTIARLMITWEGASARVEISFHTAAGVEVPRFSRLLKMLSFNYPSSCFLSATRIYTSNECERRFELVRNSPAIFTLVILIIKPQA